MPNPPDAPASPPDARPSDLMDKMSEAKKKWDAEDSLKPGGPDATDALLSEAIALAIEQGRGWKPGEREAYLEKILDDDYIPPLFASDQDELDRTGLAEAFASLQYDDPPAALMLESKKKGNEAFVNGRKNVARNVQYYRDAVNHYYEASFHADRVVPVEAGHAPELDETGAPVEEGPFYTAEELEGIKSTLRSNAAMAHTMLKNWGHARDDAREAVQHDGTNVKAWYRLAKAYQMLKDWEEAGDAIESGLAVPGEEKNAELLKLQKATEGKVRRARQERQRRERARAERAVRVKEVWRHCSASRIRLGRVPLVASISDDDDDLDEEGEGAEDRWHNHHPHTGLLPERSPSDGEWSWPVMFLYPSHQQSDFVKHLGESEMLAYRMAEMFPEPEDVEGADGTAIPWDHGNEFRCSNLAVYFEVHPVDDGSAAAATAAAVHPESVELLRNQAETIRFYESSRALKGDEGEEMANVARLVERKRLHRQRKAWKKAHGSLWAKPDPSQVVRVHPAMTLRDVLVDGRMVVPSFLVTFFLFPESHPAHEAFLKEHKCVGILQPKDLEGQT